MPLPRPASPRALWADLRTFAGERRPYQWFAAFMAVVMPLTIVVVFYLDGQTNIVPKEQLIYAESWRADRSDEEIIAAQKERKARAEARAKARQEMFKNLERKLDF